VFTLRARATKQSAQAETLLTYAERAAAGLPFYRGQVWGARAHWAIHDGLTAQAVEYGHAAVTDYVTAGAPLWEGQARLQLAEALGAVGDIEAARRELGVAKNLFAAGGARWLEAESGRAQRQVSARLPRGASDTSLTSRELQVAALVTEGLTNSAIARELVLSDRTIENHLARIFNRLGVRSRTAVAHWYTTTRHEGSGRSLPRPPSARSSTVE
jgi:DNA-binding CsgD family transcriptional regulator